MKSPARHAAAVIIANPCDMSPPSTHHGEKERGLPRGGEIFHRLGLRPLGTLGDLKLDLIPLVERLEARVFNRRIMDEDIRPTVLGDEPEPFLFIKPLDGPMRHGMILLTWGFGENAATHARRRIKKPHTVELCRGGPLRSREGLALLATDIP